MLDLQHFTIQGLPQRHEQQIRVGSLSRILRLVRQHCPSAKILELLASTTGKILAEADNWMEVPSDVQRRA